MAPSLGSRLEVVAASAQEEIVLVAPFMKEAVLRRLLAVTDTRVDLRVVTRWHPVEVATGVSDLACRQAALERRSAEFMLCSRLHAKYFRFDNRAFVGSANLTASGLGWREPSNLELLVDSVPLQDFEDDVAACSVIATDQMQDLMEQASRALELQSIVAPSSEMPDLGYQDRAGVGHDIWLPRCRDPGALFDVQAGRHDDLTTTLTRDALIDLRHLGILSVEDRNAFETNVAAMLSYEPIVIEVLEFAKEPKRFGAMRDWIARRCPDIVDPVRQTQTLYRWLKKFLPEKFGFTRGNYSEIIHVLEPDTNRLRN
ncbi:phospholipase D family protein [Rhodococcus spongiicola]|uniref:PLD phosphodiesterase domain-containing protein n=1 Tax=Rhodococcus spongiicola TaxID=2487352 RepID=A0A3S3ZQJ3_9NOCA|nr:phospholipase D family protein [Rhodococcus spongiicola]RVW05989.1 hypothetical protein EF834_00455 [Rhodococcus spongiicola]